MKQYSAGTIIIIIVIVMLLYVVYDALQTRDSFVDIGHCGVDLPSCSGERVRCMNGYCKSDIPFALPPLSDLRMTPPTKY